MKPCKKCPDSLGEGTMCNDECDEYKVWFIWGNETEELKSQPIELNDDIHVYPINDKKEHILIGNNCDCKPRIEIEGAKMLIIHNAWDFREIAEELNNDKMD